MAASAHAGVTFYSFGTAAPSQQLITDFSNDTAGAAPAYTPASPAGYGWSGSGVILDNTSGQGAEPAVLGGYGMGNFLSTEGGNTETLTIPGAAGFKDIGLYVGSLDTYNTLTFTLEGVASPVTYTGAQLGIASGAANGNQTAANTNGVFEFSFAQPVTSIEFQSSQNSFEIASITAGVPEPATWAMMILGVAMIGFAARRRHLGSMLPA